MEEYTLVEHLTELRKRLIIIVMTFILSLCIGFGVASKLLNLIKLQPTAVNVDWNVFGFTDGLLIYVKCAMVIAILLTLPIALHQVWLFVKPGLSETEAKGTFRYIPISFFLFLAGVAFSYFILFPLMLDFMSKINQSINATETYGMNQYFTFMFNLIIPVGLIFEMPVVILFLTKLGIVTPKSLRKMRKISYFILVVIGVLITPPDFISDFLIIIPLITLFEISILISSWSFNRK
ncbi:twin-arginine translocase subunit TatC [Lederbergia lenta]|uniref:Sec-independent protein translocase protein TatC n=1 Tax=Lederbergia lenta TaxID=1467 RepID=A0A2X4VQC4_LEDLE|nr:twin-arginine translocase subunit TatC [Lederbergia lenta]MCM3112373.1 twin-arginine translocase subunit TatC [Lederbergia lenta]MEC2326592.1 twin-arginine translocase subunit TatC [Lederbergia lenta]SQI53111.1 twin-arginine pre-protein translocation pathway protein [Lederbergia lenta]